MAYIAVFLTFARNSLIRDMTFRANFIIELISSTTWMAMNLGFYALVFNYTHDIAGWDKYEFFVFIATTMFVNSLVQAFFMPNAEELSEMVRTGGLDFALLKPIDTQFLVSLQRVNWSSLGNFIVAIGLMAYALPHIAGRQLTLAAVALYPVFVVAGVLILYSIMIALAATSIWLGRNQSLYDFWFYITNFSRYPMEIYDGPYGRPLRWAFTFVIPILVVINVPAGLMAKPFSADNSYRMQLAGFAVVSTIAALAFICWVFPPALVSYRRASS